MKNKNTLGLVVLFMLTIATAISAMFFNEMKGIAIIILALSILKFLIVVFQFMELKKAHVFWKTIVIVYLTIFALIIGIII